MPPPIFWMPFAPMPSTIAPANRAVPPVGAVSGTVRSSVICPVNRAVPDELCVPIAIEAPVPVTIRPPNVRSSMRQLTAAIEPVPVLPMPKRR